MRMTTNEKALLAACAGIYLAACVTAEAVAPTPKPAPFSSAREKAVVTAQTGHQWPEVVSLGTFTCYAYCSCPSCCGKWSGGPTASGTMPEEGRTVAADWAVLPQGTEIYIEDVGWRTVEDTGSGIDGMTLDVYHESHQEALEFGARQREVYVWKR